MQKDEDVQVEEYLHQLISRGLAHNPTLAEKELSPDVRSVLRQTARSILGLPTEPEQPNPPLESVELELTLWIGELRRQAAEDLQEAEQLKRFAKSKFKPQD